MNDKKRRFVCAFVNIILIFVIFILRYSGLCTLKIGEAVPNLLMPLALSIAVFYSNTAYLSAGLFIGILMDSAATEASFFNTVYFVVGCSVCSVLATRLLNRNLKAAICLSLGMSFCYFFLRYLVFFAFKGIAVNYEYFVVYLIPSVVYTAVWFIPFYFLQKKLTEI